jgi:hypothetical protein
METISQPCYIVSMAKHPKRPRDPNQLAKLIVDIATDGTPVIGLTLRYDRLDNFWFCLLHELAHVHAFMYAAHRAQGRTAP